MSAKDLFEYNQRGIFPFPNEDKKRYLNRVETFPEKISQDEAPISLQSPVKWHDWDWARSTLIELFDVAPDWPEAYYSDQKLSFWQGAMTWVFEKKEKNISLIQLRKCLKRRKYLGLYDKDEILAHEAVHAIRMTLNSPKTEEFFAYWTATSLFRKMFGPIIQKPLEVTLFIGVVFSFPVFQIFGLQIVPSLLVTIMSCFGLFRLFWIRKKINKALSKIKILTKSALQARAVLFRMTDEEIFNFSKWPIEKIRSFVLEKNQRELRWTMINLAYSLIKTSY